MPLSTINGATGAEGDITIGSASYAAIFNDVTLTCDQEQIEASTFSSEPNDEQEPGRVTLDMDVAGLLKKGSAVAGPLIPPPQKANIVVQFDTGCTISATFNFRRATVRRTANQMGTITGSARSTGAIVKEWDDGTP